MSDDRQHVHRVRMMPMLGTDHITAHFRLNEFDQPERHGFPGTPYPEAWIAGRLRPLCTQLEVIRTACGDRPIRVDSGYRTLAYNRAVGGVERSQHLVGKAADIRVLGLRMYELEDVVASLCAQGHLPLIHGVGIYPNFLHVDVRAGRLVVWRGTRTKK